MDSSLKEGFSSKGVSDCIMHMNNAPQIQKIGVIFCHVLKYYE